ncbi:11249_t:CDS:2, partial [Entrophospora sp. SA101]
SNKPGGHLELVDLYFFDSKLSPTGNRITTTSSLGGEYGEKVAECLISTWIAFKSIVEILEC